MLLLPALNLSIRCPSLCETGTTADHHIHQFRSAGWWRNSCSSPCCPSTSLEQLLAPGPASPSLWDLALPLGPCSAFALWFIPAGTCHNLLCSPAHGLLVFTSGCAAAFGGCAQWAVTAASKTVLPWSETLTQLHGPENWRGNSAPVWKKYWRSEALRNCRRISDCSAARKRIISLARDSWGNPDVLWDLFYILPPKRIRSSIWGGCTTNFLLSYTHQRSGERFNKTLNGTKCQRNEATITSEDFSLLSRKPLYCFYISKAPEFSIEQWCIKHRNKKITRKGKALSSNPECLLS